MNTPLKLPKQTFKKHWAVHLPLIILGILLCATVLAPILVALYVIIDIKSSSFTLSEKSVEYTEGFLIKDKKNIFYRNIASVETKNSILGAIFGFRTIVVQGTEGKAPTFIKGVTNGTEFTSTIESVFRIVP